MAIKQKRDTVISFAAGKRAFYLDGRLYFFLEEGLKPAGVRGTVNTADYDMRESSLALSDAKGHQVLLPFNTEVTYIGDCAVWLGNDHKSLAQNRLLRYTYDTRTTLASYFAKRTRFGVVDYRIVEDNVGLIRQPTADRDGSVVARPSAQVLPDALGAGKDALVVEHYNDDSSDRSGSLVIPKPDTFTVSGRYLAFTSRERADQYRDFL